MMGCDDPLKYFWCQESAPVAAASSRGDKCRDLVVTSPIESEWKPQSEALPFDLLPRTASPMIQIEAILHKMGFPKFTVVDC